jgi:hypothetical protein
MACIGVSAASGEPQPQAGTTSSAQPPDSAGRGERHMSVRVAEALEPHAPGALDERLDLGD